MQRLGSFTDFIKESIKNCNSINKVQEINAQYSYEDKVGAGNSLEWNLLSCGKNGTSSGYNELQRSYDKNIPDKFRGLAFQKIAMKALCECCKNLPHEKRTYEAFKKCVDEKLGIVIK